MTWTKKDGRATINLNTLRDGGFIPLLPQDDTEWVILLDWLEFAMSKEQLTRVTDDWNNGSELEEIAIEEQRKPLEILLALIHQAAKGKKLRPFAGRI